MYIFLTVLIIIVCILLSLVVLVQNPKGGGINASFSGASNQIFGAKRSTDVVEKTTWTLAVLLLVFSVFSAFFIDRRASSKADKPTQSEVEKKINSGPQFPTQPQQPAGQKPAGK